MVLEEQLRDHLDFIYGSDLAGPVYALITDRLADFRRRHGSPPRIRF